METKVKQYKGLEVEVEEVKVSLEQEQQQIDYIISQNPKNIPVEGPVEEGHTTVIDFEGFKDGVPFDGGKGENYNLVIGSHSFIPGFEEQMVGMNKGETKDLNLTFPENYQAKDLAGKEVVFKVTVHDILKSEKAILDDEFVKGLNIENVIDVESFKEYVHQGMINYAYQETNKRIENEIMKLFISMVDTEISDIQMEEGIQAQVSNFNNHLRQQGMTLEQYLQVANISMDDLKKQLSVYTKDQLTLEAGLQKIAQEEEIKVLEEDIEKEYNNISKEYNMPLEQVKQYITPNQIVKNITFNRASSIIMETAKVTRK